MRSQILYTTRAGVCLSIIRDNMAAVQPGIAEERRKCTSGRPHISPNGLPGIVSSLCSTNPDSDQVVHHTASNGWIGTAIPPPRLPPCAPRKTNMHTNIQLYSTGKQHQLIQKKKKAAILRAKVSDNGLAASGQCGLWYAC